MVVFFLKVFVLIVGGILKRWFVFGWCFGWIIIVDFRGIFFRGKVSVEVFCLCY